MKKLGLIFQREYEYLAHRAARDLIARRCLHSVRDLELAACRPGVQHRLPRFVLPSESVERRRGRVGHAVSAGQRATERGRARSEARRD